MISEVANTLIRLLSGQPRPNLSQACYCCPAKRDEPCQEPKGEGCMPEPATDEAQA